MATPSLEELSSRITTLEVRVRWWRRAAIATAAAAGIGGLAAFRGTSSAATIDAQRITLHATGNSARTVELSITPQGVLQAQFLGDTNSLRAMTRSNELVLRDQAGREIGHLGGPLVRDAAP